MPTKNLLASVEGLLRQIHKAPVTQSTGLLAEEGTIWFVSNKRGVALTEQETRAYYQTLAQLKESIPAERHGDRELSRALESAVAEVVHGTDFKSDLPRAIGIVRDELNRPAIEWVILLAVRGLEPNGLPQRIGSVRFLKRTASLERRLRSLIPTIPRKHKDRWVPRDMEERTFAEVRVSAVDSEAATRSASRAVREAMDVVNFYADFLAYSNPLLYFPGDREDTHTIRFAYQSSKPSSLQTQYQRQGPMPSMPLRDVLKRARKAGLPELQRILRSSNRTAVQRRLLQAVYAAGRSAGATTPDARLLAAVTALEAVLLPSRGEIGYRLRLRCARLLARSKAGRKNLFQRLNRIYQARSAMSHVGAASIDDRDVEAAVELARRAIVILLKSKKVRTFRTEDQLEGWFNDMSLA